VLAVPLGLLACGGSKPAPAVASGPPVAAPVRSPLPPRHPDPHVPARTHALVAIGRRAIGPFASRAGDAGLAAWVVGSPKGSGQDLYVVPLGSDGAPLAAPVVAASMADGVASLVVRPSAGTRGGWLVAWSALLDRGEALMALSLETSGVARAAPTEIERTSDHLAWFDFVPSAKGVTVCAWAEETSSGGANLLAVALDADGKLAGLPARVARGVARWQIAPGASGIGLALVDAGGSDRPGPGRLTWTRLDGEGHPQGAAIPIGTGPTVSSDVEAVAVGDGWLLGWTDRTQPDAQVTLARVDASGQVEGPVQPLEGAGSSSLVDMAAGPRGVVLAWEAPHANAHPLRELHLAGLASSGPIKLQPGTSFEIASKSSPELLATESGFALMTVAHACLAGPGGGPCAGPLAPMFVRLGPSLEPLQAEPVLLGDERAPAALAWGLRCSGDRCSALAATGDTPTSVATVDFEPRTSPFASPAIPPPPPEAPRMTGVQSIASGQAFADLVAARLGDTTLLATLALPTAAGREPGRKASAGATISLHTVDAGGRLRGAPTIVSSRAVPVGGVAIAAGVRPDDGAAIAWVKKDDGDPQVHVARIDRSGRRVREVQLTTAKGEASSVAIVAVDDGWLVAWVDGRDGNGEVYAARLDPQLDRASREERITTAPGDAADVALSVAPASPAGERSAVWVAWSDPRESPGEGLGDIYVTQLRARDARRAGDEVRLLATATHSRTPQIVAVPEVAEGGAVVAWLEDGPAGLDGPAAVMVARVDRAGHLAGGATKLPLPPGSKPTTVALAADGTPGRGVRAVVARSSGEAVTLDAVRISAAGALVGVRSTLLDLEALAPFEAALTLAGDALFFDDEGGAPGEHRVRRASIDWRR
jgi:hypothetical protein